MRILLLDTTHPVLEDMLSGAGHDLIQACDWNRDKILREIGHFEALVVRSRTPIDRELLDRATSLRCIGRFGAGMENIDLKAAEAHNIACFSAPEGNRQAVAEHALGMLLALMNRMLIADREVRTGIWKRTGNTGIELSGKTVGIIGYGQMGSAFGDVLRGFDLRVLAYDKYRNPWPKNHVESCDLATLQREADIISLHVPLTEETKYFIDDAFFDAVAGSIWLINTARGKILRTDSLLRQLDSGKVLGACLDVHEFESAAFEMPDGKNSSGTIERLLASDKVILSPHIAGWTKESFEKMATVLAGKMIEFAGS